MSRSVLDQERLLQALNAAEQAIGLSDPNPRVGCVLGREDGTLLGVGSTQQAGGPHAEVMALRAARAAGHELRGATAWVTLEPCSHHGRTPPCCDALIEAGLARVVVAVGDPNPRVGGSGLSRLRAAGIQVDKAAPAIEQAARDLNIGFFSRHERGKPWVRLKSATSLDGRIALPDGQSQWITSIQARTDGHAWRRRAGAVVTGVGTVLADNPRLDVRLVPTDRQPLRVVLDSGLRTPPDAQILQPPGKVLLLATQAREPALQALLATGAEVQLCGVTGQRVDLQGVIAELSAREINEVHVEAGAALSGALIRAGLVDELLVYLAPKLLGPGMAPVDWPALNTLSEAASFNFIDAVAVGSDLRVRARATPPRPAECRPA